MSMQKICEDLGLYPQDLHSLEVRLSDLEDSMKSIGEEITAIKVTLLGIVEHFESQGQGTFLSK